MSAADPKSLNERWIAAFNTRDWEAEGASRTSDFIAHMTGAPSPLDNAGWAAFMGQFTTAFPDAQIHIESAISEGDLVASRWIIRGTHKGVFQGVPPTGRPIALAGVDFSRVTGDRIAEHWAQFDVLGVMAQIGALPGPGGQD